MSNKIVNVLYQSSDLYAPIAGVSITSLFENNKHIDELNVYLLDDHIGVENKKKLIGLANQYGRRITFIDTEDIAKTLKEKKVNPYKGSYATYYKLFSINKIDPSAERVLYIDADTIVHREIDDLLTIDLEDNVCGMVWDILTALYKKNLGLPDEDGYFNAGVILFNCKQWKEKLCEQTIIHHLTHTRNKYHVVDQDIMCILFSRQTKTLGPEWNFHPGFFAYGGEKIFYSMFALRKGLYYSLQEISEKKENAIIYHYLGGIFGRPWEIGNQNPLSDIWDYYAKLSPWKELKNSIKKQKPNMEKIQKILYTLLPKPIFAVLYRCSFSLYMKIQNYSLSKE